MALVYLIGPISGMLIVFYKLSDIYKLLKTTPGSPPESTPVKKISTDEINV
jgi:TRAP-type C4-dicarboxylate transport system permease small subunit